MAAKLLAALAAGGADLDPFRHELVAQEVILASELTAVSSAAVALNRSALAGQIRRCLQESTRFSVRRGVTGTLYSRRDALEGGEWVEGGRELVRYWMGDRGLEVLEAHTPVLGALFRPAPWMSGRYRVYVRAGGEKALAAMVARLEGGHDAYAQLALGNE
jgi:hypothetical protein